MEFLVINKMSNMPFVVTSDSSSIIIPPWDEGQVIGFIAHISDLEAFKKLSNLEFGIEVRDPKNNAWYVTAEAHTDIIKKLESEKCVISIELSQLVFPCENRT